MYTLFSMTIPSHSATPYHYFLFNNIIFHRTNIYLPALIESIAIPTRQKQHDMTPFSCKFPDITTILT